MTYLIKDNGTNAKKSVINEGHAHILSDMPPMVIADRSRYASGPPKRSSDNVACIQNCNCEGTKCKHLKLVTMFCFVWLYDRHLPNDVVDEPMSLRVASLTPNMK